MVIHSFPLGPIPTRTISTSLIPFLMDRPFGIWMTRICACNNDRR